MKNKMLIFSIAVLLLSINGFAKETSKKNNETPAYQDTVTDYVSLLKSNEKTELKTTIQKIEKEKNVQIAVLIVNTLNGEPADNYAARISNIWKLGTNNGYKFILVLVALQDGKIQIHISPFLVKKISVASTEKVINEKIIPGFQKKEYYKGLNGGIIKLGEFL